MGEIDDWVARNPGHVAVGATARFVASSCLSRFEDEAEAISIALRAHDYARKTYKPSLASFLTHANTCARSIAQKHRYHSQLVVHPRRTFEKAPPDVMPIAKQAADGSRSQHDVVHDRHVAAAILAGLDDRSRDILVGLYVEEESAIELAARHGLTRQRIYQIRDEALDAIRNQNH